MSRVESPSTSNVFVRERAPLRRRTRLLGTPERLGEGARGLLRGPASFRGGSDPNHDALRSTLDRRPTGSGGHTHRDGRHIEV